MSATHCNTLQHTFETLCQAKKLLEAHLAAFGYRSQDLALSTGLGCGGSGSGCSLLGQSTGSRDLSFGYRSQDLASSSGSRNVAVSTGIARSGGGGGSSPPERVREGSVEGGRARERVRVGDVEGGRARQRGKETDEKSHFFSSGSCSGATTQKMMIRKVEEHGEGGGGDGVLASEEEADASEGGQGVNASVCSSGSRSPSGKGERGEENREERGEGRGGLTRATTKKMMICKVGSQREGGAVEGGGGVGGGGRGGGVNASEKVCAICGQAFSSFFTHQCLK